MGLSWNGWELRVVYVQCRGELLDPFSYDSFMEASFCDDLVLAKHSTLIVLS